MHTRTNRREDWTLRARLGAALTIVVAMTVGLGVFAHYQLDTLVDLTTTLYEHPFHVTNASERASRGVSKMNLYMEALTSPIQKLSDQEIVARLQEEEKEVYENLDIVRDRILGAQGQALERETRALFAGWRPVREEIVRLILRGERQAGAALRAEKGWPYAERVERKMLELNAYSRNKANGFMADAIQVEKRAKRTTSVIVVAVSVLSALLLYLILRSIVLSISSLKATMSEITSTGKFVKSRLEGRSEIAEMARHFNALIDVLENQFRLRDGLNSLNRELSGNLPYEDILKRSIGFASRHVEACTGALYSPDGTGTSCDLRASYALGEGEHLRRSFRLGEGVIGQVAAERRPILLRNLRKEELEARSGTLSEAPRCLYALPLVYEEVLQGVLEVASFEEIDGPRKEFLDAAGAVISTSLYTASQAGRIRDLLAAAQASNEALRAKTEDLNAANEELRSQTDELQAQAEELKAQAAELGAQQSRLQEADRLKSEFLSNMSHELRTPLNSVLALSQLMISRGPGKNPKQEEEYLRVIERNGRQLLSLINDILDLSKIESGRMEISASDFEPRDLAQRVVETMDPMARAKGLSLTLRAEGSATIRSDEDKIRQIVLNLVSNAVKFTDRGKVEVQVFERGAWAGFSVKDTGIGIAEKDLAYVFDEFRQVDGSTTRRHEGTGLGLAICQKLAALLGGRIEADSRPGVGSTFTLLVPAGRKGSAGLAPAATAQPPALPPDGPRETVLVIDDEEEVRDALRDHLETAGLRVVVARNGKEGIALARRYRPAAITLDLMMPGMDGWEVISRLKASTETAEIPVVIVSISEDRATGAALGASGYVPKPVDRGVLLSELTRLSAGQRVRRVLVVDDDPVVREQLSRILGERGYRVETASGGAEALALVRIDPPDALVLDLMMPDVDGFTVLDQLRQDPSTSRLPVVILTAKDLSAAERSRLRQAAQDVLGKGETDRPAVLARLDDTLRRLVGSGRPGRPTPLILLVEDNPVATLQIRSALEEAGYRVDAATGGQEALDRVAVAIPDAVVLDLMMPGVDGFQVLQEIRSTPRTATLPVLVLTAKELTAADRARLTHNHVQELVQKGTLDRTELVARVARLVGQRVEPERAPPAAAPRAPAPAERAGVAELPRGQMILLVEDNPDNRFTLSAILEELGHPYETVEDGVEAVAAAARLRPGLILMDVQLPGLSGLDATGEIKADPTLRNIPVVALTARAMKGDREAILAAGCDDYLSKPIDPAELAAMVRKWMD